MDNLGQVIVEASFYIYFLSFAAGMGLLSAAGIGYAAYNRKHKKEVRKKGGRKDDSR